MVETVHLYLSLNERRPPAKINLNPGAKGSQSWVRFSSLINTPLAWSAASSKNPFQSCTKSAPPPCPPVLMSITIWSVSFCTSILAIPQAILLAMSRGTPSGTFVGTSLQSVDPNMAITLHAPKLCAASDDGSDPAEVPPPDKSCPANGSKSSSGETSCANTGTAKGTNKLTLNTAAKICFL